MKTRRYDLKDVNARARGQWRPILRALLGLEYRKFTNKHQSCPICGGTDRYRYDDRWGNGDYFCNRCGAGNGWTMIQKIINCDFPQALKLVGDYLG